MQAARLWPGSTRSAAEPTTGTTAAAASADTDEHDRVCLGGLGPCPLLLKATSEHERQQMAHPEAARDVHGLLICRTPLTALVHATPVGSGSEGLLYLPCGAGLGPCPLLLKATSEHERPAAARQLRAPRAPRAARAARSSRRAWAADMPHSTHGLGTRHASRLWQRIRPAVPAMRCCCS